MKVRTITCHNVYNAGASLQAYALERYLSMNGYEVEIIDYMPKYMRMRYSLWYTPANKYQFFPLNIIYNIAKLPFRLAEKYGKKKRLFDKFTNNNLHLTGRYNSIEELENNPPEADAYICGSDQIWNSYGMVGKDRAYYLSFVPSGVKRISYAASFSSESVNPAYEKMIKELLSKFDSISCRETSGVLILKKMGFQNVIQTIDPVFLLPRRSWEALCSDVKVPDRYILVYDFDRSELIKKIATSIAKINRARIISFQKLTYSDICYLGYGPIEFISLIKKAICIISNSFHATAFSIIMHKEFFTIRRCEEINSRLTDLLDILNLSNRLVDTWSDINNVDSIDYQLVDANLFHYIEQSKEYIKSGLES